MPVLTRKVTKEEWAEYTFKNSLIEGSNDQKHKGLVFSLNFSFFLAEILLLDTLLYSRWSLSVICHDLIFIQTKLTA